MSSWSTGIEWLMWGGSRGHWSSNEMKILPAAIECISRDSDFPENDKSSLKRSEQECINVVRRSDCVFSLQKRRAVSSSPFRRNDIRGHYFFIEISQEEEEEKKSIRGRLQWSEMAGEQRHFDRTNHMNRSQEESAHWQSVTNERESSTTAISWPACRWEAKGIAEECRGREKHFTFIAREPRMFVTESEARNITDRSIEDKGENHSWPGTINWLTGAGFQWLWHSLKLKSHAQSTIDRTMPLPLALPFFFFHSGAAKSIFPSESTEKDATRDWFFNSLTVQVDVLLQRRHCTSTWL